MRKGFAPVVLLLGIVIVFALMGSLYFVTKSKSSTLSNNLPIINQNPKPSPSSLPQQYDETINWKTYIDTKNGFQFEYPSDWKKEDRSTYGDRYQEVTFNAPPSADCAPPHACGGGLNGLTVSLLSNPKSLQLQDFIKQDSVNMFSLSHFAKNNSSLDVSIDWVIDRNAPGAANGQQVLISHGSTIVSLYCGSCTDQFTNQILTTFKFTN